MNVLVMFCIRVTCLKWLILFNLGILIIFIEHNAEALRQEGFSSLLLFPPSVVRTFISKPRSQTPTACVALQVLTVASVKIAVFWNRMPEDGGSEFPPKC
jgi:hypothetical protein